eukprot:747476-Hanusia_phi.AAC.2
MFAVGHKKGVQRASANDNLARPGKFEMSMHCRVMSFRSVTVVHSGDDWEVVHTTKKKESPSIVDEKLVRWCLGTFSCESSTGEDLQCHRQTQHHQREFAPRPSAVSQRYRSEVSETLWSFCCRMDAQVESSTVTHRCGQARKLPGQLHQRADSTVSSHALPASAQLFWSGGRRRSSKARPMCRQTKPPSAEPSCTTASTATMRM